MIKKLEMSTGLIVSKNKMAGGKERS